MVWLRKIDGGTDNACWVICAKDDPGAIEFGPKQRLYTLPEIESERARRVSSHERQKP